jgi:hypothetical protein
MRGSAAINLSRENGSQMLRARETQRCCWRIAAAGFGAAQLFSFKARRLV